MLHTHRHTHTLTHTHTHTYTHTHATHRHTHATHTHTHATHHATHTHTRYTHTHATHTHTNVNLCTKFSLNLIYISNEDLFAKNWNFVMTKLSTISWKLACSYLHMLIIIVIFWWCLKSKGLSYSYGIIRQNPGVKVSGFESGTTKPHCQTLNH